MEEKVTQEEVERVVMECNKTGQTSISEFMVGTDIQERRHVWVLTQNTQSESQDMIDLAQQIDVRLRAYNADYNTFRQQERIKAPEVLSVDQNAIYEWSQQVRGKHGGQSKGLHINPPDASMAGSLKQFLQRPSSSHWN